MLLYVLNEAMQTGDFAWVFRMLLTWVPVVVIAIALHEAGHAYSALYLGDRTAQMQGRCTFNPIAHFDPLGFLMVMFGPIGWGKPVPVNVMALRKPDRDMMLTAAAGPAVNIVLAFAFATVIWSLGVAFPDQFVSLNRTGTLLYPATPEISKPLWLLLAFSQCGLVLNISLAFFNMIPLFPLDGEKILSWFLPRGGRLFLESIRPQGPIILLGLLMLGYAFNVRVLGVPILFAIVVALSYPFSWLLTGMTLAENYRLAFGLLFFDGTNL